MTMNEFERISTKIAEKAEEKLRARNATGEHFAARHGRVILANPDGYVKTFANRTQANAAVTRLALAGYVAEVVSWNRPFLVALVTN